MNGKDLLKGLGYIDEKLINEAEQKRLNSRVKFMIPMVASFVVVVVSVSLWTTMQDQGNNTIITDISSDTNVASENIQPEKTYKLHFNDVDAISGDRANIEGHFWHDLSVEQIESVLPNISDNYAVNGTAHYSHKDGESNVFEIISNIKADVENEVHITIAPNEVSKCYIFDSEPVISEIEGIKIEAGLFKTDKNSEGDRNYIYYADFMIEDTAYYMEYSGDENDEDFFTSIVASVILGGKADLSVFDNPVVPELRNDELTQPQAYSETDFGAYLPQIPNTYMFNSASRFINQQSDYLFANWSQGYNDIRVIISEIDENHQKKLVTADQMELYDMSLYSIPWCDSMPSDKCETIQNPLFKIEDLTLDMLKKREYYRSDNDINMRFSVLYGDIVVEINTEGINAEYLFQELSKLPTK